jgi:hypothetical protein
VTLIVAVITLADAAGSTLAGRLAATGPRVPVALAAAGTVVACVALTWPAALIPATIALSFATGLSHPLRAVAIQRMVSGDMRARAGSVASACDMALSTILLLVTGRWLSGRK